MVLTVLAVTRRKPREAYSICTRSSTPFFCLELLSEALQPRP